MNAKEFVGNYELTQSVICDRMSRFLPRISHLKHLVYRCNLAKIGKVDGYAEGELVRYIGIDGCKAGWVIWSVEQGQPRCQIVTQLAQISDLLANSTALIDIPIGYSDENTPDRLCDKAARKFLSPKRSSSVFPVPSRQAAYASDYVEACEINFELVGRKLSKQTWFILPKVIEVETLLAETPSLKLRESHPEVVFAALQGSPLEQSKKTPQGQQDRLDIIHSIAPDWSEVLINQLSETKARQANRDDIIDAFVLMMIAAKAENLSTLPEQPDRDRKGRVREIVYWDSVIKTAH